MSVLAAAQTDDQLATLIAMRDRLAEAMDDENNAVVAQVAGRLEAVLKRIAELDDGGKVTIEDALAKRRADRERAANAAPGARRAGQPAS